MTHRTPLTLSLAVVCLLLVPASALAHIGGEPGTGGPWEEPAPTEPFTMPRPEAQCPGDHPAKWREAQVVEGVEIAASPFCEPDNPELIAAFVKGTNHMPQELLDRTALHRDAVVKGEDLDGDGDPDVIDITLEVNELNGWHLPDDDLAETFDIAPGIHPAFWVFSPKTTIDHTGPRFFDLARPPSIPIRVEAGDQVRITLENTHYFPHTIHLHGTDHPFTDADGEGNDGVPHISEAPVKPGEARTYELTPRVPGTFFYHCHVQPQVHVTMGLGTIIIVEENRPNNTLQTMNPGAGHVRHMSKAVAEAYDREYDLVYQDHDKELSDIVKRYNDVRKLAHETNVEYDATDRDADYYMVNGRSFPYTLRESPVVVAPDEQVKLRVVNAGEETLSLHPHGHKAKITHVDGVPVPEAAQQHRDVFTLTAAQRVDLALNTTNDGFHSYGEGVWFMHDHRERAVTTDGINPGGDISVIAYESHLNNETKLPEPNGPPLDIFFTEEFYRGEVPVWAGLDMPNTFGQIANLSAQGEDADARDTPLPGALGTLVAGLLATLAVAVARREVAR